MDNTTINVDILGLKYDFGSYKMMHKVNLLTSNF